MNILDIKGSAIVKMAFIKEESEDMKIEEAFTVEHKDTETQTDLVSLKKESQEVNEEDEDRFNICGLMSTNLIHSMLEKLPKWGDTALCNFNINDIISNIQQESQWHGLEEWQRLVLELQVSGGKGEGVKLVELLGKRKNQNPEGEERRGKSPRKD
ncbi:hypothetical protein QQF64_023962 [Cirrhinus molitorella]|uniref:Uncharacterized protein n=1 Tax=Cirrhinus molitorella TaxID=172907 RepID=A0ABR3NJY1_9TELE